MSQCIHNVGLGISAAWVILPNSFFSLSFLKGLCYYLFIIVICYYLLFVMPYQGCIQKFMLGGANYEQVGFFVAAI